LSKGVRIYDASLDEKFLAENAELTALGTLGYILTSDTKALCERTVGVVGYGRIGKVLLRYLLFFGARVCLYSTKEATRRELCGYGVRTAPLFSDSGVADFSGVDILINTAPTSLAAAFKNRRVPDSMRVIELASGNNFDGISGVEALPAIPGRMYPKSAGRVYFDGIMRALGEGNL
jgi:D-arabinose 1-dehydrogenase-like Zn-dependent alcohol dehydrogenase